MTGPGEISDEARRLAAQARARAASLPTAEDLAASLTALGHQADMTPEQIRALAAETISRAQQVSYLLGKLAGLLEEPP